MIWWFESSFIEHTAYLFQSAIDAYCLFICDEVCLENLGTFRDQDYWGFEKRNAVLAVASGHPGDA